MTIYGQHIYCNDGLGRGKASAENKIVYKEVCKNIYDYQISW